MEIFNFFFFLESSYGTTREFHRYKISRKSIYRLKQSARCWNKTTDNFLKKLNYTLCEADPCIYVKHFVKGQRDVIIIIALYVDENYNHTELLLAEKN